MTPDKVFDRDGGGGGEITLDQLRRAVGAILSRVETAGTEEVTVIRSHRNDAIQAVLAAAPVSSLFRSPHYSPTEE